MSADRWEKDRAAWILARAGHSLTARRRGEKLALIARRRERYEAGSGDAVVSEVTTRSLFHRIVHQEEGAANTIGWFLAACIGTAVGVALLGPAVLVGHAAYGLWILMIPGWGRLSPLPYVASAVLVTAVLWLILSHSNAGFLGTYLAAQLVLGLLVAAWLTRAWGWPAVARKTKQSSNSVKPIEIHLPTTDTAPTTASGDVAASAPVPIQQAAETSATEAIEASEIAPIVIEIDVDQERSA